MSACGCGKAIHRYSRSGLCKSCAAKRRYMDPAERQKMSDIKKEALKDPEKRSRVREAASRNLSEYRARTDKKTRKKVRRGFYWKVPPSRRGEYEHLRKVQRFGAAEAYRIIDEDERKKVHRAMGIASEATCEHNEEAPQA